jgi:hypothetical protein
VSNIRLVEKNDMKNTGKILELAGSLGIFAQEVFKRFI